MQSVHVCVSFSNAHILFLFLSALLKIVVDCCVGSSNIDSKSGWPRILGIRMRTENALLLGGEGERAIYCFVIDFDESVLVHQWQT